MMILATAAQMKELDRTAIEDRGVDSLYLMENAARAAAEALFERLPKRIGGASAMGVVVLRAQEEELDAVERKYLRGLREVVDSKEGEDKPRIAIFCGPGNNGGDGVAAARLMQEMGCVVRAFLVGKRADMTADCRAMEEKLNTIGITLEDYDPEDREIQLWVMTCDGIMDALFGVGLNREVGGSFKAAIELINRVASPNCPVVSCDVPSGIHADTGQVLGVAVKADATVTFTCAKPGLYLEQGRPYAGEILVAPIDIPHDLVRGQIVNRPRTIHAIPDGDRLPLPRRPRTAHKGDFGKVFILAGCEGFTGAPVLAARAAVRSGAGLVYLGVPRSIYPIVAVKCDEAMPFPLPEDYEAILKKAQGCDVAVIGPGLGRAPETEALVRRLLTDLTIPVVLDADGINSLEGHTDVLKGRTAPTVLTPHDGEFQRLTGAALPLTNRLERARRFAEEYGCVLVLKGHTTITAAPDGRTILNATGNPGMAKGGCGDVLAGLLGGLLGQKQLEGELAQRVAAGVWYHGSVGDLCARELGEYGMIPSDMLEKLPKFLRTQEENR